jgi:hypothetical protein
MICVECLDRISELERLECIHKEKREAFRSKANIPIGQLEQNLLRIAERDARLDALICRLELKRHQRNHVKARQPDSQFSSSTSAAIA